MIAQLFSYCVLLVFLGLATYQDSTTKKIKNLLLLPFFILGILLLFFTATTYTLTNLVVITFVSLFLYVFDFIPAGDSKAFIVLGLFVAPLQYAAAALFFFTFFSFLCYVVGLLLSTRHTRKHLQISLSHTLTHITLKQVLLQGLIVYNFTLIKSFLALENVYASYGIAYFLSWLFHLVVGSYAYYIIVPLVIVRTLVFPTTPLDLLFVAFYVCMINVFTTPLVLATKCSEKETKRVNKLIPGDILAQSYTGETMSLLRETKLTHEHIMMLVKEGKVEEISIYSRIPFFPFIASGTLIMLVLFALFG